MSMSKYNTPPPERPAILQSGLFQSDEEVCLTFFYLVRRCVECYFKVYANYIGAQTNQTIAILDVSGDRGEIWWEHHTTLPPGNFFVAFEATSTTRYGDVLLDDVLLRTERCMIGMTGERFIW